MPDDFIALADWSTDELTYLLDLADDLKKRSRDKEQHHPLSGKTVVLIFEKPSLRTRLTFETGVYQLGGYSLFMEERLGAREPIPDVARNLDRWVDGIVARTHSHTAVEELAHHARIPVINALTDKLHPCQVLADALTVREHFGTLEGLNVAFVGDGNNMCASWANLATRFAFQFTLVCPAGFELEGNVRTAAEQAAEGRFRITNDLAEGVTGADVVYTDVWASMGQEHEQEARRVVFSPYQVNAELMARAKDSAVFMHCLPAHRGEEVTDDVIESAQSVVFDQAENRLHAQKAVMVALMKS